MVVRRRGGKLDLLLAIFTGSARKMCDGDVASEQVSRQLGGVEKDPDRARILVGQRVEPEHHVDAGRIPQQHGLVVAAHAGFHRHGHRRLRGAL